MWRRRTLQPVVALAQGGLCLALALGIALMVVLPRVDRWQDLGPTIDDVAKVNRDLPIALYQPDETIVGQLTWHAGLTLEEVSTTDAANALAKRSPTILLLAKLDSDRLPPGLRLRLIHWVIATGWMRLAPGPQAGDGDRGEELVAAGWTCVGRLEIPAGRRYGLFSRRDSPLMQIPLVPAAPPAKSP
jgi:hypothetical protein